MQRYICVVMKIFKAQATIEFMSTYGFMFLLLGIAIVAVVLITSYTNTIQNTVCTSYSNLACNFVQYYTNSTFTYSVTGFSFTNTQSVPINITSISGTIGSSNSNIGICSPSFIYPAQESMCEIVFNGLIDNAQLINGIYNISVGYCNSAAQSLNSTACIYNKTNYGGAFEAYTTNSPSMPFTVIVGQLPSSIQLETEPSTPIMPSNYTLLQNGDLVGYTTQNSLSYAFGSSLYLGSTYFGDVVQNFPGIISYLNNNGISCATPYNSILSMAYSTFYMYQSNTITINAYATNAIQVYYKNKAWNKWVAAFTGSNWNQNNAVNSYTSQNTIPSGTYQIAVAWVKTCGDGVQALQVTSSHP